MVPLELWGPERRVECEVKFHVAKVAYPMVLIESGFTFSFDEYKCYMHKDNKRVEIFRKGPNVRVENKAQVAADQSSNGCAHRSSC